MHNTKDAIVYRLKRHAQHVIAVLYSVPVEMRVCRQCDAINHIGGYLPEAPVCPRCNDSGVLFIEKDKLYRYNGIQIA